jgi:putative transposase
MVVELMTTHQLSQRRACGLIGITRRSCRHVAVEDRNRELRQRLRGLAEERRRWGCPMLYQIIRRQGFAVNHKRVERLYREEGLSLRRRRRRKRLSHVRVVRERPQAINQVWAVDFVHDSLLDGRGLRALTMIDEWSRECLAIEVDLSLTGERVTRVLEWLCETRGAPMVVQSDTGPEFSGRAMDGWACGREVRLQFIEPGKPIQNASSNRSTAAFARNASTSRPSSRSRTHGARLNIGECNTTANGLIRVSATGAGGVRGTEQTTKERAQRAHRLASQPHAGRRGATRGGLGQGA